MIREAMPGDRVQVIGLNGKPRVYGCDKRFHQGVWHVWDFTRGNKGTVSRVLRLHRTRLVYVKPDPPGTGEHYFMPRNLKRLKQGEEDA